jgi:hypothetical protein
MCRRRWPRQECGIHARLPTPRPTHPPAAPAAPSRRTPLRGHLSPPAAPPPAPAPPGRRRPPPGARPAGRGPRAGSGKLPPAWAAGPAAAPLPGGWARVGFGWGGDNDCGDLMKCLTRVARRQAQRHASRAPAGGAGSGMPAHQALVRQAQGAWRGRLWGCGGTPSWLTATRTGRAWRASSGRQRGQAASARSTSRPSSAQGERVCRCRRGRRRGRMGVGGAAEDRTQVQLGKGTDADCAVSRIHFKAAHIAFLCSSSQGCCHQTIEQSSSIAARQVLGRAPPATRGSATFADQASSTGPASCMTWRAATSVSTWTGGGEDNRATSPAMRWGRGLGAERAGVRASEDAIAGTRGDGGAMRGAIRGARFEG